MANEDKIMLDFVEAFLQSSSDDEDPFSSSSEDEKLLFFTTTDSCSKVKLHRMKNFIEVIEKYGDNEFRKHFRVRRDVALKLIEQYSSSEFYKKEINKGRKKVPANVQMYLFLWFAGNKDSYREVSNIFNVSTSSAFRILSNILDFMFKNSPQFIKFPKTEEEKIKIARAFENIAGFKDVIGCIDGCYIYIRKPANKIRSTYINRHDLLSLTLQGICDADKRFTDVFVGSPSRIHDARIFQLSFISDDLPGICGSKYHILGDAAYPVREYLLTPYKDFGKLTKKKIVFNKKLSQTRVKIENAFGLLKVRFRQLIRLDFFTVERMCKFILACCVLHNICIDEGDIWTEEADPTQLPNTDEPQPDSESQQRGDITLKRLGEIKRNVIADSF